MIAEATNLDRLLVQGQPLVRVEQCANAHAVVGAVKELASAVHHVHSDGVKRRAFHRPELRILHRAAGVHHHCRARSGACCMKHPPLCLDQPFSIKKQRCLYDIPEHGGIDVAAETDEPTLAPLAPSVIVALTVTLLAALPWFVTSADVCIVALAATWETRPAASVTLFGSPMSAAYDHVPSGSRCVVSVATRYWWRIRPPPSYLLRECIFHKWSQKQG